MKVRRMLAVSSNAATLVRVLSFDIEYIAQVGLSDRDRLLPPHTSCMRQCVGVLNDSGVDLHPNQGCKTCPSCLDLSAGAPPGPCQNVRIAEILLWTTARKTGQTKTEAGHTSTESNTFSTTLFLHTTLSAEVILLIHIDSDVS